MNNVIIYLIGFPGVGKYTIAKEIAALVPFRIMDNHLVSNAIFQLVRDDGKTTLPPEIWDYTGRVMDVVLDAMANLAKPESSFILTNCLYNEYPPDRKLLKQVQDTADKRGSLFVPVRIMCDLQEVQKRIVSEERNQKMKWMDPDGIKKTYQNNSILDVNHLNLLNLDVTHMTASEAATHILNHVHARKS